MGDFKMRHCIKCYVSTSLFLLVLQLFSSRAVFAASIVGDFNGNGIRDVDDVDLLHAAYNSGDLRFDVTGDGSVNYNDLEHWLEDISNTFVGDVNLDGEFNAADMIIVFGANKYETGQPAKWSEGDWTDDGVFTSTDFGNFGGWQQVFESGPRPGGIDLGKPPVALGDFDGDGEFTTADVDLLSHEMVAETYNQDFDLNADGTVDFGDRQFWIRNIANTFFGDANFDGEVGSEDWIHAFKFAKYETDTIAHWEEGDFNGDLRFNSSDFVTVVVDLPHHPGPRVGGLQHVPEHANNCFLMVVLVTTTLNCRRWRK